MLRVVNRKKFFFITLTRTSQPETRNLQRERSLKPGELFL